jgi:hypothetical protein
MSGLLQVLLPKSIVAIVVGMHRTMCLFWILVCENWIFDDFFTLSRLTNLRIIRVKGLVDVGNVFFIILVDFCIKVNRFLSILWGKPICQQQMIRLRGSKGRLQLEHFARGWVLGRKLRFFG